jgi:hypothetical protein
MTEIVRVQFRDAMRPEWQAEIEDGSGYTASNGGVTQVFGRLAGTGRAEGQLAAFPGEAILAVVFEPKH